MKESIGYTYLLNVIIIFLLIVVAVIMGTISYSKSFRVNSKIVSAIEKYEGYNTYSIEEINKTLRTIGYSSAPSSFSCQQTKDGYSLVNDGTDYMYCVYEIPGITKDVYIVITYMTMDFPLVENLRIPVSARTDSIYRFE